MNCLILLAYRNTVKENISCSSVEFVFGTPLSLPGDISTIPSTRLQNCQHHLPRSSATKMARLKHLCDSNKQVLSFLNIWETKYVFVRNDAVRKPLTQAYQGPFKVLQHSNEHITIKPDDTTNTVAIDQTKQAFLEDRRHITESTTPPFRGNPTAPHQQTRSGRKVTFPSNLHTDYL